MPNLTADRSTLALGLTGSASMCLVAKRVANQFAITVKNVISVDFVFHLILLTPQRRGIDSLTQSLIMKRKKYGD
jgi:hypothetical protein